MPEIPFTLEDISGSSINDVEIGKFFGKSTRYENFYLGKDKYRIPAGWYGDSLMICLSNDCGSPSIVSVLCCARNGLKTRAGIQVGDSESKLLESYSNSGNKLNEVKNGYYYIIPSEIEYSKYIYFQVKNERVRKIYVTQYFDPSSDSSLYAKLYKEVAKAEGF